jgi:two-component system, NtrC family, sensor kinase
MNHANIEVLRRSLERERHARLEAEKLLEDRSRELFEAQEHLVQSEKMASIGQMAAGLAHEINNPMGYLHGNIDFLKEWVDELATVLKPLRQQATNKDKLDLEELFKVCSTVRFADIYEMIADATVGVWKVVGIVRALQMFTRMGEAKKIPIDLREELQPMIHNLTQESPEAQIHLDIPEGFIIHVAANDIVQACQHLVQNGLQATSYKGMVTLKASKTKASESDKEQIHLTIQDDGPGVDPNIQHKIFEPFFSNRSTESRTGLGLTLAQAIAKNHGGYIKLEESDAPGACFTMILPKF